MKIGKIIRNIQTKVKKQAILKHEAYIHKYYRVHDVNTYGDSYNQLDLARDGIVNHAKVNNVSIDVYDAKDMIENLDNNSEGMKELETSLADKLHVVVTNLLTGQKKGRLVSANTDKFYPKIGERPKMILPVKGEYTEYSVSPHWTTNDSFLSNFYRNIEDLTKEVTGKKN